MSYRGAFGVNGRLRLWVLIAVSLASVPSLIGQEKGGGDETGAYQVVEGWLKPLPNHDGWVPGPITAIFAESPDRVFVIQRGELPLPDRVKPGPGAMFGAPGRSASSAVSQARRENYVLVADRNGRIVAGRQPRHGRGILRPCAEGPAKAWRRPQQSDSPGATVAISR